MELKISGIEKESIVDGKGLRYVIYTQGCLHNCKGCHNPETHDIVGGRYISFNEIIKDLKSNPLLKGVTLSGGDPILQSTKISKLIDLIQKETELDIWLYTGYTLEQLLLEKIFNDKDIKNILSKIDMLVDGKFEESLKQYDLEFRGSSNQRLIKKDLLEKELKGLQQHSKEENNNKNRIKFKLK